ncbi:MAG: hypothetical protein Q7T17_09145 [Microbacterium sp.]|uniref:hypothetical protein n=1 Tax=Microbacterium sp. TaxID=51671 RepID=UPI00271E5FA9|nr:hypothetical protein [Microbacterium sp.]MDO8383130.1 hypothetical protein [Microbacterium sp.]
MTTDERRATSDPQLLSATPRGRVPESRADEGAKAPETASVPIAVTQAQRLQALSTADRHADMRTMVITVGVLGGAVALAATAQAVIVLGIGDTTVGESVPLGWDLGRRIFINLLTVISTLIIVSQMRIETRRALPAAALVLTAGVGVAALRAVMQIAIGVYSQNDVLPALADAAVSGTMISLIIAFAVFVTRSQQRVRRAERTSHLPAAQSSQAVVQMLRTQARGRHKLASNTHAALKEQFQHVMHEIAEVVAEADGLVKLRLQAVQHELADVAIAGEKGLALFSYPEALEHGLIPAVRAFISTVPNPIAIRLRVSDSAEVLAATGSDARTIDRRAVVLQTIVESVLNALQFCHAQRIDITIGVVAGMVRVSITNDGTGSAGMGEPPGLDNLRRQVSAIGGRLEAEMPAEGGCSLIMFTPPVAANA